jgi:hypothetical protein
MDQESLYMQLGHLVETMPDLTQERLSVDTLRWLGRAHALVYALGDTADALKIKMATDNLGNSYSRWSAAQQVAATVHRALAMAELAAPVSAQGAFIPAGNAFDAMAAVGKVLSNASRDLLIVDPYMDEKVLTDFAPLASESVAIRLLADKDGCKPTLRPAAERWSAQYREIRPLSVRLAPTRSLHDRLIIADDQDVWVLTQSLNAFAARSPASIVRSGPDTAALKVEAYRTMWKAAAPL